MPETFDGNQRPESHKDLGMGTPHAHREVAKEKGIDVWLLQTFDLEVGSYGFADDRIIAGIGEYLR